MGGLKADLQCDKTAVSLEATVVHINYQNLEVWLDTASGKKEPNLLYLHS